MIKPSIRGSQGVGRCMSSDSGGDPYHSLYQTSFTDHAVKSGINQGLSHVGDDGQVWSLTQFMPGVSIVIIILLVDFFCGGDCTCLISSCSNYF